MTSQKAEATIAVPSKDPPKKEDDAKDNTTAMDVDIEDTKNNDADDANNPNKKKKKSGENELSAEDAALKLRLTELVEKSMDSEFGLAKIALDMLKDEIRTSTSSMTSVPKPLKYLSEHYPKLKKFTSKLQSDEIRREYADLLSVLAMTMEEPHSRVCLKYRLLSDLNIVSQWGAQYVKHLAAEIRLEMEDRLLAEEDPSKLAGLIDMDQILLVVTQIVEYYMANNAEPDACDILLEVERLDYVRKYTQEHNHERVCEYLRSCAAYLPPPDDLAVYRLCFDLYLDFKNFYHAMRFALKLDDKKLVKQVMRSLVNRPLMKRQCAYLLGWHNYGYDEDEDGDHLSDNEAEEYPVKNLEPEPYELALTQKLNGDDDEDHVNDNEDEDVAVASAANDANAAEDDDDDDDDDDEIPEINDIIANIQLSEAFHNLARDLDVLDPKDAETDIFKDQQLSETTAPTAISARKSLAIAYVNAFVNAGYGKDKLMLTGNLENADDWIAKNKERGQLAAVASIGSLMLWDEDASNSTDRYFTSEQSHIRGGSFLAIGMSCSGMRSENGIGYALLHKPVLNESGDATTVERMCATLGLGMAYAGQANEEVYECLMDLVSTDEPNDVSSMAALALGFVFVGTCNSEISNLILCDLMERAEENTLDDPIFLLNVLGLSLLFLQRQEIVETTIEAVATFEESHAKFGKTLAVCLECFAYAGTGNVLKIQKMLGILGEKFDDKPKKGEGDGDENAEEEEDEENADEDEKKEKKKEEEDHRYFQSIATMGISVISMGEQLGSEMSLRMFNHLIQYGNRRVKRAVPLALALSSVGHPNLSISDILSKLSHDSDEIVSRNAIFGLGLIASGTNNARIARMLRELTTYFDKEADHLYVIRLAQGLVHMGKGLLTMKQFHSDRFLMSKVGFSAIITVLTACIAPETFLLGDKHFLLYILVMAIKPRMLVTLDSNLNTLKTSVRVGQALDVVGQAGKPKSITGFQTHDTPVLLGYKDRAELATDEHICIASVLEGFAIVRENPNSETKRKRRKKEKLKSSAL